MADTITVPLLSDDVNGDNNDVVDVVVPDDDAPKPNVPVSEITVGVVKEPNPAEKRCERDHACTHAYMRS